MAPSCSFQVKELLFILVNVLGGSLLTNLSLAHLAFPLYPIVFDSCISTPGLLCVLMLSNGWLRVAY